MPGSKKGFSPEERAQLIKALSHLESSGNKNTEHSQMNEGIHAGDSAIGEFGLMPNTAKETATRLLKEQPKRTPPEMLGLSPLSPEGQADARFMSERDALSELSNLPNEEIKAALTGNKELEQMIVNKLINQIGAKTNYDPEKAILGWHEGQNKPKDFYTPEVLDNSGRVKVFREKFKNK